MSKRTWKVTMLVLCGGTVLQIGGCAGGIGALLAQQLVSGLLSSILAAVVSGALGTADEGTTP
jgi:hypothetical protein